VRVEGRVPLTLRISQGGRGDLDAQSDQFAVDPPTPQSGFSRASRWTKLGCSARSLASYSCRVRTWRPSGGG
jgi:hypothetical protein